MYPSVTGVVPRDDFMLDITFSNGEYGVLDMKPYLGFGVFKRLRDCKNFGKVSVAFDTIEWEAGADLDPEFVYDKCKKKSALQNAQPESGH
ncbi:MAG: DUF2442 domain-containing protein [Gemmataceae bacterium]|nr:DUF2442 domain-containing protein [Gemmataceae bacterium]MBJ7346727.1 DUF2442 domain-containing protein [Gemmataceae bacterium]